MVQRLSSRELLDGDALSPIVHGLGDLCSMPRPNPRNSCMRGFFAKTPATYSQASSRSQPHFAFYLSNGCLPRNRFPITIYYLKQALDSFSKDDIKFSASHLPLIYLIVDTPLPKSHLETHHHPSISVSP